tara:strand:+ start:617 stop:2005 length:1389 start_codon:yes stop_codon:yes gene_type:complete
MEEYKFSDSNLDFNELRYIYARLNPTYSDINNLKINIYENCNLSQDSATFPVPSTNIRLSSFKNNYIDVPIANSQTLELNQAFYDANKGLFTIVVHETKNYISNINLTAIITNHFVYTNPLIFSYHRKKIIIKINLHETIVDADGSGALQINMKEIKDHFHSLSDPLELDTLELDILQYVTGKHGALDTSTDRAASDQRGGNGQNADVDSAGPAIIITDNEDPSSYFTLNIKTNDNVRGGFGASGGKGGNGIKNLEWTLKQTTSLGEPDFPTNRVEASYSKNEAYDGYELKLTFIYNGDSDEKIVEIQLLTDDGEKYFDNYDKLKTVVNDKGHYYFPILNLTSSFRYAFFMVGIVGQTGPTDATVTVDSLGIVVSGTYSYRITGILTRWERTPIDLSQDYSLPTDGEDGSIATYSNNAGNVFYTQDGDTGTANDGEGGTGGTEGNPGGIINITAANIHVIEP